MKTALKSMSLLVASGLASAHHHGSNKLSRHHTPVSSPTDSPPQMRTIPVLDDSETFPTFPPRTTEHVWDDPNAPLRFDPVIKAMSDTVEEKQTEEVIDTFYRLFYSGHLDETFYGDDAKVTEGNYQQYKKDDPDCPGCNTDKRYRDFDYQYSPDGGKSQTCYAIERSDEGYKGCTFEDISGVAGAQLTNFTNTATDITLQTSFPFYDRYLEDPTISVFMLGFITLTPTDPLTLSGGNSLPNPSVAPFDTLAPYYQSQNLDAGNILFPGVYVVSTSEQTIIQWETNEGRSNYDAASSGSSIYQLKIKSSGDIYFVYKLSTCEFPLFSTVQVGVKPQQTELQQGYRTSFFQTACQNGQYLSPCAGQSIKLKRVKCCSLIGQTGIQKPKVQKKYSYKKKQQQPSYKKEDKSHYEEYREHKQRLVDHFHSFTNDLFQHFH